MLELEFKVIEQDPVPEHAPAQPENVEPEEGDAERVTEEPAGKVTKQVEPQEIPEPETVPEPVPDLVTERVYEVAGGGGGGLPSVTPGASVPYL